jgi:hypothetical protein
MNPRDLITKAAEIASEADALYVGDRDRREIASLSPDTVFNMAVQLLLIEANKAEAEASEPRVALASSALPFPRPKGK